MFVHQDGLGLLHVMETRRPGAGPQANHAAHRFGEALQQDKRAGDRDQGLEEVDLDAGRAAGDDSDLCRGERAVWSLLCLDEDPLDDDE